MTAITETIFGSDGEAKAEGANTNVALCAPEGVYLDTVTVRGQDGELLLDQVDFAAEPGQVVAIVGASGSGKSTLLEVMAGTLAPWDGTATIGGHDSRQMAANERRSVGFVPQQDVLHEDLRVDRSLLYSARLRLPRGTPVRSARATVTRVLDLVELRDSAGLLVRQLSGGQRRRLSLATELLTSQRCACWTSRHRGSIRPWPKSSSTSCATWPIEAAPSSS